MDSLNLDKIEKEIMNLDVTTEGSSFYSSILISRDSLLQSQINQSQLSTTIRLDMSKAKQSKVNFGISKIYPNLAIHHHISITTSNLVLTEKELPQWSISQETSTIGKYNVQKATTRYLNRNWTAWFTTEIPIQDGPYKFCALPGLILSIKDDKDEHTFILIGTENKITTKRSIKSNNERYITNEKFNHLWNEYKNDPAKTIKLTHSSSQMEETLFFSNTGSPLTKQDLIRRKEENSKIYFKNNNNFIEKNLYQ